MKRVDLGDLMGAMEFEPGTWFQLLDSDTQFSDSRASHPWVFPDGWSHEGRFALVHALPRTTSRPWESKQEGVDFIPHKRHGLCHGEQCYLDRDAWVLGPRFPVTSAGIGNGTYLCVERSAVLGQIQTFDMELPG